MGQYQFSNPCKYISIDQSIIEKYKNYDKYKFFTVALFYFLLFIICTILTILGLILKLETNYTMILGIIDCILLFFTIVYIGLGSCAYYEQ